MAEPHPVHPLAVATKLLHTPGASAGLHGRRGGRKEVVHVYKAGREYSADNGFTIGFDYIPGSADVSSNSIKRTDATADANETTQDDGDRTANAEIENHTTIYAEVPLHNGLFFKGGYVEMDVNTTESETVAGGSTYGTKTVDGLLYGLGYRNSFGTNGFYKVEGTHTAFDSISLASSSDHKISADLDVTQAKFSIGYNF